MTDWFPKNEGAADRIIRVVIGIFGVALVFAGPKTLLGLFGLIPLVTGLAGNCPLYTIFGVTTCRNKAAPAAG